MNGEAHRGGVCKEPAALQNQDPLVPLATHSPRCRTWAVLKRIVAGPNVLAILDQSVVSGTRFVTSIIVGRACGPHELGDYTLGFTLYCLAACIQTGLIALPFTIHANHLRGDERRAYAGSVLAHFATFALVVAAVLGLAAGAFALGDGRPGLATLAAMLALTFPLALLVEFARRFALAGLELTTALVLDAGMAVVQVGGLVVLACLGQLSAEAAFAATGLGGAVAGLSWLAFARRRFLLERGRVVADALRNWRSGRWNLASQLVLVARTTAVLWLLALMLDPASTGIFVAADTLVRLSAPLLMAVANVQFARSARAFAQSDLPEVRRLARHAAAVLGTSTSLLCVLFIVMGDVVLGNLYGPAYAGQGAVLALLALAMVADALEIVATHGLLALDRSDVNFAANLVGTVFTLASAVLLVPSWGIVGAAWGSLLGRVVTCAVLWVTFLRLSGRGQEARQS